MATACKLVRKVGKNAVPNLGPICLCPSWGADLFISLSSRGEATEVRAPIIQLFLELWHPGFDLAKTHPYIFKFLRSVHRKQNKVTQKKFKQLLI